MASDRIEVTRDELAIAIGRTEVHVNIKPGSLAPLVPDGAYVSGTVRYPDGFASELLADIAGQAGRDPEPFPDRDALAAAIADPGQVATAAVRAIAAIVEGYADPEVRAMAITIAALSVLPEAGVMRVLHWLCERHGIEFQP